ncbi:hypothetical protein N7462_006983 [Penicillium macrosclerotiorum]|uniref:uncharacterized protein n=1 Tax=Penicillium macrosclerotiorum TaxID=303699 RepID=UPI002546D092|nr:uncharacterized protein N7462_006983 [Penicillium macrosclerotiorum]KAJ5678739.1 hypothetical protein N7462_006983 [Penicillium macrosclerotiorum]
MNLLPPPGELLENHKLIQSTLFPCPEKLLDLAIESHIAYLEEESLLERDDSFFIADLGQVARQHRAWRQVLPEVHPYYAVKCNSDPTLLKCLADLGTGFDCASVEEMRIVLSLGVDPSLILFANPCKSTSAMNFARRAGVVMTTFDNIDELEKVKLHMPDAALLLRIHANDDGALICFGEKFGAHLDITETLISRAWDLQLSIVGVSFHVGTGASNPQAFCQAIKDARHVFGLAENQGFNPTILDIGGGFQDTHFSSMAPIVRAAIHKEFSSKVTVIAEPGRYYARSAYTIVSQIIARRCQTGTSALTGFPNMLYQNDGVYGNFMNVIMEKEIMTPQNGKASDTLPLAVNHRYSIWGPTCDSIDCVVRDISFDRDVKVAYTLATATQFNGFNCSRKILYVNSEMTPDN